MHCGPAASLGRPVAVQACTVCAPVCHTETWHGVRFLLTPHLFNLLLTNICY
jgi:hypothetical protein